MDLVLFGIGFIALLAIVMVMANKRDPRFAGQRVMTKGLLVFGIGWLNPLVIQQIQEDLKSDGVCFYKIEEVPPIFIDKGLIHPEVLEKCSFVSVAASGCPSEGRNYMFLAGCRVDSGNGCIVTDIDPIVMVADLELGSPAASGCMILHADYEGRTQIENVPVNEVKREAKGQLSIFHFFLKESLMSQLTAGPALKPTGQPSVVHNEMAN